jgi:hypothetical protein
MHNVSMHNAELFVGQLVGAELGNRLEDFDPIPAEYQSNI